MTHNARPTRLRKDIAALENVRLRRAQAPSERMPRGSRYVVNGEAFHLHRVTPEGIVLRGRGGFIVSESTGPIDPSRFVAED